MRARSNPGPCRKKHTSFPQARESRKGPMPYRPKRPCSWPGCPNLTYGRFCPLHERHETLRYNRFQRDPETAERYGKDWRRIRKAYLAEHPFCEVCRKKGKATVATMVHHIRALREDGTNDDENLMALCKACHSRLHAQRGDRWHNH